MTRFSRRGFLKSLAALAAEGLTHTSLSTAEKMVAVFQESKKYVPALIKALSSVANPIRYSVFDIKGSNGYIQSHSALGELPNLLCGLKLFLEKSNTRETMLIRANGEFARYVLACSQMSEKEVKGIQELRNLINKYDPDASKELSPDFTFYSFKSPDKVDKSLSALASAVNSLRGNPEAEKIALDYDYIFGKGRQYFGDPLHMLTREALSLVGYFDSRQSEYLASVEEKLSLGNAKTAFSDLIASALRNMGGLEDLRALAANPLLITQSRYYMAIDDLSKSLGWANPRHIQSKLDDFRTTQSEMKRSGIEQDSELEKIIDNQLQTVGLSLEPAYLSAISIETQLAFRSLEGEISISGQLGKNGRLFYPEISMNGCIDYMDDAIVEKLQLFFEKNRNLPTQTFEKFNCKIPKDSSVQDVKLILAP